MIQTFPTHFVLDSLAVWAQDGRNGESRTERPDADNIEAPLSKRTEEPVRMPVRILAYHQGATRARKFSEHIENKMFRGVSR